MAEDAVAASALFGARKVAAAMAPAAIGSYAGGCLAGGKRLADDGPHWQAMRLSRNRHWGHPDLIALIERLSAEAAEHDGWPGLLVGDLSQPRGGPMTSGHASHQIGLDADIWLIPAPEQRLTRQERESMPFQSMLKSGTRELDPARWTQAHEKMIMRAAGYDAVERIFVHPAIKQRLCETWRDDAARLRKIRPYWGHDGHIHIRITCRQGSPACEPQAKVPPGDGCGESLEWWLSDEPWRPTDPDQPVKKTTPKTLSELPPACAGILAAAPFADVDAQPVPVPTPVPRP